MAIRAPDGAKKNASPADKKVRHIHKRIGQLCWILAEKSVLKGFTLWRHADFTKCTYKCCMQLPSKPLVFSARL